MHPHLYLQSAAVLVSLGSAITDARTGRIPNMLTLPALVGGLLLNTAFHGTYGAAAAVAGVVLAGGVPALLHRVTRGAAIGGGDVKLFAALGALLGPSVGLQVELLSFGLLTVFALIRLAFLGRLFGVLLNVLRLVASPLLPKSWRTPIAQEALTEMRLGPAIAAAMLTVALSTFFTGLAPWLG
jgi:prepilin peptidase CpaA